MEFKYRTCLFRLLTAVLTLTPIPVFAQGGDGCDCNPMSSRLVTALQGLSISEIGIAGSGFSVDTRNAAAAMWNATCGVGFNLNHPVFTVNAAAPDIEVRVERWPDRNSSDLCPDAPGCGCTDTLVDENGNIRPEGAEIHVFDTDSEGNSCVSFHSEVIAHEFGHILGMDDVGRGLVAQAREACLAKCRGNMMAAPPLRRVQPEDCAVTDTIWSVPDEPHEVPGDDDNIPQCLLRMPNPAFMRYLR